MRRPHDAELGRLIRRHRQHRDGHVRLVLTMRLEELPVVHAIELIAGENQNIHATVFLNVADLLTDCISRPLIPIR